MNSFPFAIMPNEVSNGLFYDENFPIHNIGSDCFSFRSGMNPELLDKHGIDWTSESFEEIVPTLNIQGFCEIKTIFLQIF